MKNNSAKYCIRLTVFAVGCLAVVCTWKIEQDVDLHGIPFGIIALVTIVPWFFVWFMSREIWREHITRTTFFAPLGLLVALGLATAFDVGATSMRRYAPRMMIANDLKQICLAIQSYQQEHGTLPPAVLRAADGTPLHSWRVLILPYLEQNELFSQFQLDKPWNSPHNRGLADRMPKIFRGPDNIAAIPNHTHYQVFVGPGTAFEAGQALKSPEDFPDGISSTFLVVEARDAVSWTQPTDLRFNPTENLPELGALRGKTVPESFMAGMVDSSVRAIKVTTPAKDIRAWITRNGKEKTPDFD